MLRVPAARGFGAVVCVNNKHSRLAGIVCADVDTRGAAAAGTLVCVARDVKRLPQRE